MPGIGSVGSEGSARGLGSSRGSWCWWGCAGTFEARGGLGGCMVRGATGAVADRVLNRISGEGREEG